jgi:hypothetical protein
MIVGAWCRDILHSALGHTFATAATHDLDLALALSSWDAYRVLTTTFQRVGDTGIRFRIADIDVDVLPFGDIEDPQRLVHPPARGETLSVWAFEEIFAASLPLALSPTTTIQIPTIAGPSLRFGQTLRLCKSLLHKLRGVITSRQLSRSSFRSRLLAWVIKPLNRPAGRDEPGLDARRLRVLRQPGRRTAMSGDRAPGVPAGLTRGSPGRAGMLRHGHSLTGRRRSVSVRSPRLLAARPDA